MKGLVRIFASTILVLPITAMGLELTCPVQVQSAWTTYTCPDHSPDCCYAQVPFQLSYQDLSSNHTFKGCAAQPAGDFANQVTLFRDQSNKLQMLCAYHYADKSVSYLSNVKTTVPSNCRFKPTSNTVSVGAGSMACKGPQQACVVECP